MATFVGVKRWPSLTKSSLCLWLGCWLPWHQLFYTRHSAVYGVVIALHPVPDRRSQTLHVRGHCHDVLCCVDLASVCVCVLYQSTSTFGVVATPSPYTPYVSLWHIPWILLSTSRNSLIDALFTYADHCPRSPLWSLEASYSIAGNCLFLVFLFFFFSLRLGRFINLCTSMCRQRYCTFPPFGKLLVYWVIQLLRNKWC